jgi:hypothetical protein
MQDVVRSSFQTRILGSLRRYSFAGDGLPERMRSTAFAFLGLTAAIGLALVAIFAQINFSVLSPAPLPSGPSADNAVSEAVVVDQSRPAIAKFTVGSSRPANEPALHGTGDSGAGGSLAEQGGVAPTVNSPPEPGGGTSGNESVETPTSNSPSVPSAEPAPSQAPTSEASPPKKPTPTPARPSAPTPAPAPGNSQSTAAASHASDRGIEASSKQSTESSSAKAAASATEPAAEPSPGNGNGKALGNDK